MTSTARVTLISRPRRIRSSIRSSEASTWARRISSMGGAVQKIGDLIDVLAHGSRGTIGIALPQRPDDGFMSKHGSAGTTLLFQRELARFHQEVVQGGHDADDHAIARRTGEGFVKRRILNDRGLAGLELLALR